MKKIQSIYGKKRSKKLLTAAVLLFAFVTSISLSGCPKACVPVQRPADAIDFTDKNIEKVFMSIFEKDAGMVTESDMSSIECFQIMTYSETNTVTVALSGYLDIVSSENPDYEKAAEFVKTTDITDYIFESYNDLGYLTGLREFTATYTSFPNFDFLAPCKELERFSIVANTEIVEYSFLSEFPKLYSVSISESSIKNTSDFEKLTNLTELTLDQISSEDYLLSDPKFLSGLTNLKRLSLASGMVFDISALSSLENLEYLNLAYNGVEDVSPIANLKKLKYIDLTQNLISDVSPLTNYNAETFERLILDLNSGITDWSPLDYLDNKVQGKPLEAKSETLAEIYGTSNGRVFRDKLSDAESLAIEKNGDEYIVTVGFKGYLDAAAANSPEASDLRKAAVLRETPEEFYEEIRSFTGIREFIMHNVDCADYSFLYRCDNLESIEISGNGEKADLSVIEGLEFLSSLIVTESEPPAQNSDFFEKFNNITNLKIN